LPSIPSHPLAAGRSGPASTLLAWALLLLLAPALLALGGCAAGDTQASENGPDSKDDTAAEDKTVPVEVAALETGPIEEVLRFSTNLEAEQAVGVFSQAARQVVELRVEEGDRVSRGQVLLRLQDDEQQNELAKVEGQLARARREHERQKNLWAEKLIPEQAFNEASYELDQLELALEETRRQLSYTVVRAPIAGTVTGRLVNLGDQVTVNQHLFDLVDFDSLVARVYVPEKELSKLRPGLPARIVAPALAGAEYAGRVARLAPVVDPRSGTVKVTVGIPDWQGLRPGLYVDVSLVTDVHEEAVLVPKRALVYDQDQVYVFRLAPPSDEAAGEASGEASGEAAGGATVERVLLRPVLEDKRHVEPAAGTLEAGDRVVIAGQAGLKEGAAVRVLDLGARASEAAAPGQAP
jgi:membrane fusion protein (multidrug efflux system)